MVPARMLYRRLLKPALFRFDPEDVHDVFIAAGDALGRLALTREALHQALGFRGDSLSKVVDGIEYRTPVLLAAGFDCNGRLTQVLPSLGFGGEEIGSITARPCAGNPRPRLTRLVRSQSILVNKGLRNDGVDAIITRLKQRPGVRLPFVRGISIARTNDAASAPMEAGIADYVYSFRRLVEAGVGDYYTFNISCPNAFGGEAFTDPRSLDRLLSALSEIGCSRPRYVKLPINLPWEQVSALLTVIDRRGLNGIVIGNLNKKYEALRCREEAPAEFRGGVSGQPCAELSTRLIAKVRAAWGSRFTLFGVGGILSEEAALEKLAAGADLLQLITGMIFEGPSFVSDVCRAIGATEPAAEVAPPAGFARVRWGLTA